MRNNFMIREKSSKFHNEVQPWVIIIVIIIMNTRIVVLAFSCVLHWRSHKERD